MEVAVLLMNLGVAKIRRVMILTKNAVVVMEMGQPVTEMYRAVTTVAVLRMNLIVAVAKHVMILIQNIVVMMKREQPVIMT